MSVNKSTGRGGTRKDDVGQHEYAAVPAVRTIAIERGGDLTGADGAGRHDTEQVSGHLDSRSIPVYLNRQTKGLVRRVPRNGRAETSAELRLSEERYQTLYEQIPLMYFMLSPDGTVVSVNSHGASQLGYSPEELVGSPVLDMFHPDDREDVGNQLARVLVNGGNVAKWEFRKLKKDGEVMWVRESVRTARDKTGRTIVLVVCEDITEQKGIREELRELAARVFLAEESERQRVACDLHDHVGHALALIRRRVRDLADEAASDGRHDLGEIEELLDDAIAATRSLTFDLSPPCLYDLGLAVAAQTLGDRLERLGGFRLHLVARIDEARLGRDIAIIAYRGLQELLINVVKHANAAQVHVSINMTGSEIEVWVADDGEGFDVDDERDLWSDSFGLFALRERVRHMGGSLHIASETGGGTCVQFALPLVVDSRV